MLAGYCRDSSLIDALLLTYSAKKKAEAAPHVGPGTDMVIIRQDGGELVLESEYFFVELDNYHLQLEARLKESRDKILEIMKQDSAFAWCSDFPAPTIEQEPK